MQNLEDDTDGDFQEDDGGSNTPLSAIPKKRKRPSATAAAPVANQPPAKRQHISPPPPPTLPLTPPDVNDYTPSPSDDEGDNGCTIIANVENTI